MKVAIVGSRNLHDMGLLHQAIAHAQFDITEILSGGARGIDTLAEQYALHYQIPLTVYPADWAQYGSAAGYRRNVAIVQAAEAVIAVWDGKSKGTQHSINLAIKYQKPLYIERR